MAQTKATKSNQRLLAVRGSPEHLANEINELLRLDTTALRQQ
jgi:hypothetical protein